MTVPDNNNNNNNNNKQQLPPPAPKFHPTIFKYKCRGIFFSTSDDVGSNGVCHGIQSQLQHVRDLHPSSKEESIQNFLQDFPQQQQQESSTDSAVLQVPAMIYKGGGDEATTNSKKSQRLLNDIILSNNNNNDDKGIDDNDDDEWHDWSCYGTTEVRLLILKKDGNEETVAVAPVNKLGLTVRDVGSNKGGDMICTVRLGPLEVLLRNQYEMEDEVQQQQQQSSSKSLEGISNNGTQEDSKQQPAVIARRRTTKRRKAILQQHDNDNHDNDDNDNRKNSSNSISALTILRGGEKVFAQSTKIVSAMKTNATILKDAVKDDFPNRCWEASGRITNQFEKTVVKTTSMMQQLYRIWSSQDDNDD